MLRTFSILAGLVFLLGAGLAVATLPRGVAPAGFSNSLQLGKAYARVEAGVMPVSGLSALGFDIGAARRLSRLGLMETLMPKDSFGVDALAPALRDCLTGQGDCTAYVFAAPHGGMQAIFLVESGHVVWKTLSGVKAAALRRPARMALY
jgi:hypothetical protein